MKAVARAALFLDGYSRRHGSLVKAVSLFQREILGALSDDGVSCSVVYGRAKSVDSVRGKLLKKSYKRPAQDMTDQLGVRVVTLRASEVDGAVSSISKRFKVVRSKSIDKRGALGLREFGYRSVHLICKLPSSVRRDAGLVAGSPSVCEVQVRSLLEHAWAEIEHGVVYKAGADLPQPLRRRFASLAGAIELMEGEFERLDAETKLLVEKEKSELFGAGFSRRTLDVPRLIAILEVYRPYGSSLRLDGAGTSPVSIILLTRIVDALRMCGVKTAVALAEAVHSTDFVGAIRRFSASEVVNQRAVSHLAVCLVIIGCRNRLILETFFPEFSTSPSMLSAFRE